MPRLDRLPQISRNNLPTFPAQVNEPAPFVHPPKLLAGCRLAIVTTAGLHVRGDRPFTPGDCASFVVRRELGRLGPRSYSFTCRCRTSSVTAPTI
jgi:hypothetical protein